MINNKTTLVMLILIILLLIGCANKEVNYHNYTYRGESKNWIGEFEVSTTQTFPKIDKKSYHDTKLESIFTLTDINIKPHYDTESEYIFTLTYKGEIEDLLEVQKLQYSYEYLSKRSGDTIEKPNDNEIMYKEIIYKKNCDGAQLISRDYVIEVIVEVDGKAEIFALINTNRSLYEIKY
jgi:hypothetical protein